MCVQDTSPADVLWWVVVAQTSKARAVVDGFHHFTSNEWRFTTESHGALLARLSASERQRFPFSSPAMTWPRYGSMRARACVCMCECICVCMCECVCACWSHRGIVLGTCVCSATA